MFFDVVALGKLRRKYPNTICPNPVIEWFVLLGFTNSRITLGMG